MSIIRRIKTRCRQWLENTVREAVRREVAASTAALLAQFADYLRSSPAQKQSAHDLSKNPQAHLAKFQELSDRLLNAGVVVQNISIDIADFRTWLCRYVELDKAYKSLGDVHIEKCLEHYLSHRLLALRRDDVFVDIAAAGSPYANLLEHKEGVSSYRLDLTYAPGIVGRDIGANAAATGLPAMFANGLALHCAFECFAGNADTDFLKEACRVLKPGGNLVILPLYADELHCIVTSPFCEQRYIPIDLGAVRLWRDDEYIAPFSRHYSPAAFYDRVYGRLPAEMPGTVYFVQNLPDLMREYPGQRIYCFFVLHCHKAAQTPHSVTKVDSK